MFEPPSILQRERRARGPSRRSRWPSHTTYPSRSVERGKQAASGGIHFVTAEPGQFSPSERVVRAAQIAPLPVAQHDRPSRGVHDVGEEQRSEDALRHSATCRVPVKNSSTSPKRASTSPIQGVVGSSELDATCAPLFHSDHAIASPIRMAGKMGRTASPSPALTTWANCPKLPEPVRPHVTCSGEGGDMYGIRGSSPAP